MANLDPFSLGYVSGNAFGVDMTHLTLSKLDSLAWSRPAILTWFFAIRIVICGHLPDTVAKPDGNLTFRYGILQKRLPLWTHPDLDRCVE